MSEFTDKTYMTWAKTNKKSWPDDEMICKAVRANFKGKRLAEISTMDVGRFKKVRRETPTRHGEPRSAATVTRELTILSRVLALAVDAGHIGQNPCRRVRRFKEENARVRFLSDDEEARLMKQIGQREPLRSVVIFALNTGLRRGEIFSLRRSEVNWSRNFIHVADTKTGRRRIVPLDGRTRAVLQQRQQKSQNESGDDQALHARDRRAEGAGGRRARSKTQDQKSGHNLVTKAKTASRLTCRFA